MDIRLQWLESRAARGSDGRTYKVMGYERLVRDESLPGAVDRWAATGQLEYRLDDGRVLQPADDGSLRIGGTDVTLDVG